MAEKETPTPQDDDTKRQFSIQKIYVKDMSFESPAAPKVFTEKFEPQVNLNISSSAAPLSDSLYQVVLAVTATIRKGEQVIYLVEIQQAGIFSATGFPDAERRHLLGSYCPNVLFPYDRGAISDIVTKGGFPQLLLQPVNFDALYAQHLQKQRADGPNDALNARVGKRETTVPTPTTEATEPAITVLGAGSWGTGLAAKKKGGSAAPQHFSAYFWSCLGFSDHLQATRP